MNTNKVTSFDFGNLAAYRDEQGLNQSLFWSRFGITQSGGSRYEKGRGLPKPLAMLLLLHASGVLTDDQLSWATSELEQNMSYCPE